MRRAPAAEREGFTEHVINVIPALPAVGLALIAVSLHYTGDFGVAYRNGIEAWATGRPLRLELWTGTPFLALVMASITRVAPEFVAARVYMAVDLSVWLLLMAKVWFRLHGNVPARFWWLTLAACAVFAPAISTIFWLQFNLVVFALGLGGFVLIARHDRAAGLLIGMSLALKPVLILLPLALLLRRRSRVAGAWAIATSAVLNVFGLVFLAWRAGDWRVLNPFAYLEGFLSNGRASITACVVENYSPIALLCRLGVPPSTAVSVLVAVAVAVAGWLLIRNLPETAEGEWEVFAAACFLSTLVGPIAWNHYGLLTGPLFLLVAYQFWREGAPRSLWVGLGIAFLLTELVWDPLSSIAGASVPLLRFLYTAGQFGQYFLLLVWIRWRLLRREPLLVGIPKANVYPLSRP
jgi:hypothetical protein